MNVILGASGQVGSHVAKLLESREQSVRRVFHHAPNQATAKAGNGEYAVADYMDAVSLTKAFRGGDTVLLLTPESMTSEDILSDAKKAYNNYKTALIASGIRRVVGLSSGGAQMTVGTGTLQLYALLEETLQDLEMEIYIVRPAYYYSNWMMYWEVAKSDGVLPAFFPVDMAIPMIAPKDVAAFIAEVMDAGAKRQISEMTGPELYTPLDIARIMGEALGREVAAVQVPREDWLPGLLQAGFSKSAAEYLMGMTEAVIEGKTGFTMPPVQTGTTFAAYLNEWL